MEHLFVNDQFTWLYLHIWPLNTISTRFRLTAVNLHKLRSYDSMQVIMATTNALQEKMNSAPRTAGVYLFYEKKELIYIGKAINIRDRVKNHFNQPSYRDNLFIEKVSRVEFINTNSEIEALVLE